MITMSVLGGLAAGAHHLTAQAPARQTAHRPDPADASVRVPPAIYTSVVRVARDSASVTRIPWKEANDEVACIGGWRAYAREAAASAAKPGHLVQSKQCSDHRSRATGDVGKGDDNAN